ncbi:MAG TPA: TonB-dependent receptor plug domain-containing protein [Gemmatimonadales bacterium]|nr:TonB-dependent receptor plug domain-containing protein [Gemmatimonadales bacterium]
MTSRRAAVGRRPGRPATSPLLVFLCFLALLSGRSATLAAQTLDDTLPPDSLAQDTVDYTGRYLEAQEQVGVRVPVMPSAGVAVPRPALTRIVFDRDSIEWGHASTVSDLLLQVPGVFLWRGGFVGRPEPVNFQGRGSTSVEYFLDGLPYVATGVDSVAVDPALFSISFLDRIEVERWPGLLRVHLFTRRHDRRAPRSRIGIARGDRDFARYEAALERRGASGVGFVVAGDYLSSPTASGSSSGYSNTQIWVQGGYVPSERFGAQVQVLRSGPNRRPFVLSDGVLSDTVGLGFDATRTDAQVRVSLRSRPMGLGSSVDLVYGRTAWDGGGVEQRVHQLGGYVGHRTPTLALGGSAFYRSRWTPLDLRGAFGATPAAQLAASAQAVYQRHDGSRTSRYLELSAGLQPVRGLAIAGSARLGEQVVAPAVASDTAQELRDLGATIGWERERLGLQLGWSRTAEFSPFGYAEFPRIVGLAPTTDVDWLTLRARIAPVRWVTLEGWYSDPRKGSVEGIPPTLSLAAVTLRSKFLRQFPSGSFDLKLRLSVESWGRGVIGRDGSGTPVTLKGATFFRSLVQFQLQSFSLYWDRGNLSASELTYVPGFELPAYGTTFGVRWEFLN